MATTPAALRTNRAPTTAALRPPFAPHDGRGRRVTLTGAGVALVDELIATHLANERRLLSALTGTQVSDLAALLALLAEDLEADHA